WKKGKDSKKPKHVAHRHGAARPRSPRTVGWFPPRSRAPVETPRLRPTSPPRSRVANQPSNGRIISASLEATPRRKGQTALQLTARRTEALSANHSSTVLRTDGVRPPFPTMVVTGIPSANSGHCSAIPGAVAILWDLRRGMERARHCSPYYSANSGRPDSTSSHVWPRAHLLLGRRFGVATGPSKRDAHHSQPESRTSPLEGPG